ncbi:N-acetyltransferase [Anaerocolumna cellulosilytica]|uniref:N-acetyltransferase n=1 Tax=Anaerocolumna cellulosilytica TaxID=433286 RepID=A0A6S6R8D6_9FIRM|nr:GNAT family protein [Anaerocolumna cellulosilytica]MBB5197044.1 putative acetyltransferase [Anaerocolumna cellulosilytica]BCJ95258.1 N-acetyltransferase [Anaerocolumna cellulosilytica]
MGWMKQLETERLILRAWRLEDINDLYEYASNPEVGPKAGWKPHESLEESERILQSFISGDEVAAIVNKENNKVIGSLGLHGDGKRNVPGSKMLGYVLSRDYWGRGLMGEAVQAILKHAFLELELNLVSVYHYPFNEQSKKVILKSGFQYEGTIRFASRIFNGEIYDDVCYSIKKEEWQKINL